MRLTTAIFWPVIVCMLVTSFTTTAVAGVSLKSAINAANGHTYHEIAGNSSGAGITWTDAESTAVSLGGHLVTINDDAENNWVADNFKGSYYDWIGLNDAAQEGHFVWSSGQPVTYTKWAQGEPNNMNGNEDYAQIYNWSGMKNQWNDMANANNNSGYVIHGIVEVAPAQVWRFGQDNPLWNTPNDKYGNSQTTIAVNGCALSSLAMVLNHAGISQNPGTLNTLMKNNAGYSGLNVNWFVATREAANAAGSPKTRFVSLHNSSSTEVLDKALNEGHPVIVGVDNDTHYVVVTGKQGNTYSIADPGYADQTHTTLDSYNNNFRARGYVVDPPDVSELDISVFAPGSGVNLLLRDFLGNKTGINQAGLLSEEIPNSVHFKDSIVPLGSAQPPTEVDQLVHIDTPASGEYGIDISGIDAAPTSYTIIETAYAPDGSRLWQRSVSGIVAPGSVDHFAITYTVPEPSGLVLLSISAITFLVHACRRRPAA